MLASVEIHPTAIINKGCQLGTGVRVGPYSIIGKQVILEDHVQIESHAVITGKTRIGAQCGTG